MLEREKDKSVTYRCDGFQCHEYIETEEMNFSLAARIARENGWRVVKKHDWFHYCPDCEHEAYD